MSGLRMIANTSGLSPPITSDAAPYDWTLTEPATSGQIVVVVGIRGATRAPGHTSSEFLTGVSDSVGNTYLNVASIDADLDAPGDGGRTSPPFTHQGMHLAVFTAYGTLGIGDTIHIDAGNTDPVDSLPALAVVYDATGNLLGVAASATNSVVGPDFTGGTPPPSVDLPDPLGLGVTLNGPNASWIEAAVQWNDGSELAAYLLGSATFGGFNSVTGGWSVAWDDYLFVATPTLLTASMPHLSLQFRSFLADEDEATTTYGTGWP